MKLEATPLDSSQLPTVLAEYGDEANLHKVRMEAAEVFDTRLYDREEYVVLWIDAYQV